jgi:tryptophan-rich sensory protein
VAPNGPLAAWPALLVFLVLVAAVAVSGAVFKPGVWYEGLTKPDWTPPSWLFPPVWTLLYIAVAVAGWLVWTRAPSSPAMAAWAAQLVLNAAWSWLFFGLHRMDLGLADIGLLWLAIGAFVILAWPISMLASLLFVPYWVWVSYAGALNLALLRLNG